MQKLGFCILFTKLFLLIGLYDISVTIFSGLIVSSEVSIRIMENKNQSNFIGTS